MVRHLTILLIIFAAGSLYAQQPPDSFQVWGLRHYSGSVGLRGFYREQRRTISGITDFSTFPFLYGNIQLNTQSYLGHPNLLLLDIGGEFNPGLSRQRYTVSPDRSEVLTFARLNTRATLFSGKPVSLSGHFDLSSNYINREYVTSLRTDARLWGVNFNLANKILPFTASYSDRQWNQLETETGRTYRNRQKDIRATVSHSFTRLGDKNELSFNSYDFFQEDQNLVQVYNRFTTWQLTNMYYLDGLKNYSLRSFIIGFNQRGTTLNQDRLQILESVNLRLPKQFRFSGNFDYTLLNQQVQSLRQMRLNATLEHQLYASLRSSLFVEQFNTYHSAYQENNLRTGISFNYIKKIPTGTLNLQYSYKQHRQQISSKPGSEIRVFDEPHVLSDGEVVLLNLPYIDPASVVVKDNMGAIIYQLDFDYRLVRHNEFLEVVRIPGGQIPNNAAILVDYTAAQVGTYSFIAHRQLFTVRLVLFRQLLEMYYSLSTQDYSGIESPEFVTLNFYQRHLYGGRLNIWLLNIGIERDEYRSTIVPYEKMRYYLRLNGRFNKKWLFSVNGDITDLLLTEDNTRQFYASLFGKMVYRIKPRTSLRLDTGYRKQIGEQIDLDLVTAKLEFNTAYRNLYMRAGVEVYRRFYISENFDFKGIYFQIDRRF